MPVTTTMTSQAVSTGMKVEMEVEYAVEQGAPKAMEYTVKMCWETDAYPQSAETISPPGVADRKCIVWADRKLMDEGKETFTVVLTDCPTPLTEPTVSLSYNRTDR